MIDKRYKLWQLVVDIACRHAGISIADYLYNSIMNYNVAERNVINITFSGAVVYANRMEE